MTDYNSDNEDDPTIDCEDEEDIEDDEATLDEEDALNDEEDYGNELKELEEDGQLSMEELRRKYCVNNEENKEEDEIIAKTSKEEENFELVQKEEDVKNAQTCSFSSSSSSRVCNNIKGKILDAIASTCDAAVNNYFKTDELEEDESEDYLPPELWKKEIRIGQDYQVSNIPQIEQQMTEKNKLKIDENCKALWIASPECCPETIIIKYLIECEQLRFGEKNGSPQNLKKRSSFSSETASTLVENDELVPDDENALFALYSANYNIKKALLKAPFEWPSLSSINGPNLTKKESEGPLSEEECQNFEKGMFEYGKQFLKIQQNYLPKRAIGELVSFYYCWKKSERYNIWQQNRRESHQHVNVKCVDLMGKIAESILRQTNQIDENNDKQIVEDKQLLNEGKGNLSIQKIISSSNPSSSG